MFRKWKEDKDAEIREEERKKKRQQERELRDKQEKEADKRKDNEHAFRGWYEFVVKKVLIMDVRFPRLNVICRLCFFIAGMRGSRDTY